MKATALIGIIISMITMPVNAQRSSRTDGFRFKYSTSPQLNPSIKIVLHDSNSELLIAMPSDIKQVMLAEKRELHAWSKITGNRCEVHIIDPKIYYAPEFIGHEITHCLYKQFHD